MSTKIMKPDLPDSTLIADQSILDEVLSMRFNHRFLNTRNKVYSNMDNLVHRRIEIDSSIEPFDEEKSNPESKAIIDRVEFEEVRKTFQNYLTVSSEHIDPTLLINDWSMKLSLPPISIRAEAYQSKSAKREAADDSVNKDFFKRFFNYNIRAPDTVILDHKNNEVLASDLGKLEPRKWLNDRIINVYMSILSSDEFLVLAPQYYPNALRKTDFYCFNTFFSINVTSLEPFYKKYKKISPEKKSEDSIEGTHLSNKQVYKKKLEENVKKLKWITRKKKEDITTFQYLFMPFVSIGHWTLFIIHNFQKFYSVLSDFCRSNPENFEKLDFKTIALTETLVIYHLDSLNQGENDYAHFADILRNLMNLIIIELLSQDFQSPINLSKKILNQNNTCFRVIKVPHQQNGVDCGIAIIENIEQAILTGSEFMNPMNINKKMMYPTQLLQWKRHKIIEIFIGMERRMPLKSLLDSYLKSKAKGEYHEFNSKAFQ
jgi:hypothetical protein